MDPSIEELKRRAGLAIDRAGKEGVRDLIIQQAVLYVQSRGATLAALDQRMAACCALLLAAATFAAGLAFDVRAVDGAAPFAALAAFAYVGGGGVALAGMRTKPIDAAGVEPAWWNQAAGLETFELTTAQNWLAATIQEKIARIDAVTSYRASSLNLALTLGLFGGVFTATAASLAIFAKP